MYDAGNGLPAIYQMFDFFQFFQLLGAVEASSAALMRWAEIVPSLPSPQPLHSNASQRGNAANTVKVICQWVCHIIVQVQTVDKDTAFERIVQYVRDFEQAAETSPWVTRGNRLWSIIVGCIDTDRRFFAVVGHAGRYGRSLLVSGRAFYNNKIRFTLHAHDNKLGSQDAK